MLYARKLVWDFFFLYVNKKKLQNIIVMKQIIKTVTVEDLIHFRTSYQIYCLKCRAYF